MFNHEDTCHQPKCWHLGSHWLLVSPPLRLVPPPWPNCLCLGFGRAMPPHYRPTIARGTSSLAISHGAGLLGLSGSWLAQRASATGSPSIPMPLVATSKNCCKLLPLWVRRKKYTQQSTPQETCNSHCSLEPVVALLTSFLTQVPPPWPWEGHTTSSLARHCARDLLLGHRPQCRLLGLHQLIVGPTCLSHCLGRAMPDRPVIHDSRLIRVG